MKKVVFILCSLLFVTTFSFAVPLKETQYKVGEAKFKYLFWKIYKSTLYSPEQKFISIDQAITLSIDYQRNIPKKRIVNATINQWEHLNFDAFSIQKWGEEINKIIPEIKKGDNLSFYKNINGQGEFYHNNELIAQIDDKDFSESFLSIWLSENTSEPKLRSKLINRK